MALVDLGIALSSQGQQEPNTQKFLPERRRGTQRGKAPGRPGSTLADPPGRPVGEELQRASRGEVTGGGL